jgi:hypothetical protein
LTGHSVGNEANIVGAAEAQATSTMFSTDQKRTRNSPSTLGDVLYAKSKVLVRLGRDAAVTDSALGLGLMRT